jgi:sugar O-acyltransferase (sialic acid O-acetyltransferase NeuD family)
LNNKKNIVILQGGGDHARVVLDCLLDQGIEVSAIYDPKHTGDLFGVQQKGKYQPDEYAGALSIIAIGDNEVRKRVALSAAHGFMNAVHRSVVFSSRASMGVGNMILQGAIVQANAVIGNHVIVNTGAKIDHDCKLGDFVHIAPGATLCGTVTIGEGAFVGAGATIIPGRKIGAWSVVGAGAVVVTDIPDHTVAFGNPARVIKSRNT